MQAPGPCLLYEHTHSSSSSSLHVHAHKCALKGNQKQQVER